MFKLNICKLATNEIIILDSVEFPTSDQIMNACGVHPTEGGLVKLKQNGYFSGIHNHYTIKEFTIPTVTQLQALFVNYFKVAVYQGLRFGQYVYNNFTYEVGNSYNETDNDLAYKMLLESITQNSEVV